MKILQIMIWVLFISPAVSNAIGFAGNLGFSLISENQVTSSVYPVELSANHKWQQLFL